MRHAAPAGPLSSEGDVALAIPARPGMGALPVPGIFMPASGLADVLTSELALPVQVYFCLSPSLARPQIVVPEPSLCAILLTFRA